MRQPLAVKVRRRGSLLLLKSGAAAGPKARRAVPRGAFISLFRIVLRPEAVGFSPDKISFR